MIDIRNYGAVANGTTDCSTAINNALIVGDIIIQDGTFLINTSIKIPSNRTVYGKNAKLKLGNTCYDNIFRNSDFVNGNTNVNIIGLGNFYIDCNAANNSDSLATYGLAGPNSYKYVAIQIYNVTTFQIKNLSIDDLHRHCMHIGRSSYGTVDGIYFNHKTVIANQDGIDILWGTHHCTFNDISGYTADDFIAIDCGVKADMCPDYSVGYNVGDIHDLTFTNIKARSLNGGMGCPAVICGNGNKLYNIAISDVRLYNLGVPGAMFYSCYGSEWDGTAPAATDIYNITIDNAIIDAIVTYAPFRFGHSMSDCTFTNITNNSGKAMYLIVAGDLSDNVTINGTQVE